MRTLFSIAGISTLTSALAEFQVISSGTQTGLHAHSCGTTVGVSFMISRPCINVALSQAHSIATRRNQDEHARSARPKQQEALPLHLIAAGSGLRTRRAMVTHFSVASPPSFLAPSYGASDEVICLLCQPWSESRGFGWPGGLALTPQTLSVLNVSVVLKMPCLLTRVSLGAQHISDGRTAS